MGMEFLRRSFLSSLVHYSTVTWTIFCIVGAWFFILKFAILPRGLIAVGFTLLFAMAIWSLPFLVLLLLSLFTDQPEKSNLVVDFQELMKRGLSKRTEAGEQEGAREGT